MARTLDEYRGLLMLLLPRGKAWPTDPDSETGKLFKGLAEEARRAELRIEDLIEESDPRTVNELIDEWEIDWGLPTKCTGPLDTLQKRRDALVNRMIGIADQSRQTYIDRAAQVGYTITITEYVSGDSIPGHPEIPTADAAYAVQINATLNAVLPRTYGGLYGEPYATWGDELLECTLREISLAHHVLIFSYT